MKKALILITLLFGMTVFLYTQEADLSDSETIIQETRTFDPYSRTWKSELNLIINGKDMSEEIWIYKYPSGTLCIGRWEDYKKEVVFSIPLYTEKYYYPFRTLNDRMYNQNVGLLDITDE